jgi:hypothetical protein
VPLPEPVLDEVDAQHPLEINRQAVVAALRVMRLDHFAQLSPRRNYVRRAEQRIAPRPFAACLETRTLIGCHYRPLLLHPVLSSLSTPIYNVRSSSSVGLVTLP